MSFFFGHVPTLQVAYTVKKDPLGKDGDNTILVGSDVWADLLLHEVHHAALSISPSQALTESILKDPSLERITCWASLDVDTHGLTVPHHWMETHGHIFSQSPPVNGAGQKLLQITPVEPITLTEVVLAAQSPEAFGIAQCHSSSLEAWLCDGLFFIRDGQSLTLPSTFSPVNGQASTLSSTSPYRYTVDLVLPCQQGYCKRGLTRLFVTFADATQENAAGDILIVTEDDQESILEDLEISECFLVNSAISPSSNIPQASSRGGATNLLFGIIPLVRPVELLQDDSALYLRTVDLGTVGLLSGDWAVIRYEKPSQNRLVRVFAKDSVVVSPGVALTSPLLLFNICSSTSCQVSISRTPFDGRRPPIPVATSVTVARIASPFSTERSYEPSFLRSLRLYFTSTTRLVKRGDVVAVRIDTNVAASDTGSGYDESFNNEIDWSMFSAYPAFSPRRGNTTVFFIVRSVDYDANILEDANSEDMNTDRGFTKGDYGCWVDPRVTRVIQIGLEQNRIPDLSSYTGLDHECISSNPTSSPALISPSDKILHVSNATRVRDAGDYGLELSILFKGARGTGKFAIAARIAQQLGVHLVEVNCFEVISDSDKRTEGLLRARIERAGACSPCVLLLRHIEAVVQSTQPPEPGKDSPISRVLAECLENARNGWKIAGHPVIIIATTSDSARIPPGLLACFKHEIAVEAPSESERLGLLRTLSRDVVLGRDVSLLTLAVQTAALVPSDLTDLVVRAQVASRVRMAECKRPKEDMSLYAVDFDISLQRARAFYAQSIGAPKIPNVTWDDVGGLALVKNDILDTVQLPLDHPELFADGLKKRSGILLYGPPGTGKTLLAKAVATSCSLNFFSVKGPELLNMYIGESEANVRRIFQKARDAKPCVIFFDELDSVAPKRGNQGDSGGVMDRIVSQLLAELDGMSTGRDGMDVFVIGATNRPDLLDPALLRPGRFDRMLYLGVSETHEAQGDVLRALTRRFHLHPALDLHNLAKRFPFNYTGADLYALCSDAMLNAMSRKVEELESRIAEMNTHPVDHRHPYPLTPQYYLAEMADPGEIDILVSLGDFDLALRELVPSVSQLEMDHYAVIRQQFSERMSH
ncbi:AAA-domain-containing protein [Leucogyrophana mollusca]|uniref:AAA-domain-containing protein n=1 Tax=Leucogyrophana mollusca TaxID=85980 RepID=A0ACB8B7T1_9AGAM|nr:AAA-domain-containing protein [Leucogyrophana mollusca]